METSLPKSLKQEKILISVFLLSILLCFSLVEAITVSPPSIILTLEKGKEMKITKYIQVLNSAPEGKKIFDNPLVKSIAIPPNNTAIPTTAISFVPSFSPTIFDRSGGENKLAIIRPTITTKEATLLWKINADNSFSILTPVRIG